MRAKRTLLIGMPLVVMLGAFALPPVAVTGGAAYAAEISSAPPAADSAANQSATSQATNAVLPSGQNTPLPDDTPFASKPGPLPLATPISQSAQCPAAPLPPHVQRSCAEAAAQLQALHAAAAQLPNRRDIRMGITEAEERTALAAELYTPLIEGELATAGTGQSSGAQGVTVTLLARPDAAETLLRLLRNPDVLALRHLLLTHLAQSLALAPQIALEYESVEFYSRTKLTPGSGGTWYVAKVTAPGQLEQHPPTPIMPDAQHEAARKRALTKADNLAAEIAACLTALGALRLSPEGWLTSAEALPKLENAAAALPRSAAVQLLLAEAQLQAGMPQRSIHSSSAALELAPTLARGRYIRALAHWRLQQMALAEDDLSAALNTADDTFLRTPDRVRMLRARGALRMLRNKTEGMCSDLTAACALGDCEGLAAARNQMLCTGQAEGESAAQPSDKGAP